MIFTVPIGKEITKIEKNREYVKKIYPTYYNLLIAQDLMARSLSTLVNNLSEGLHKIKCKYGHSDKKRETF